VTQTPGQPDTGLPDAELARRACAGDRRAEAQLCARLLPRVRAFGLRRLRDADAADELSQQAMAIAIERLRAGALERPGSLASFVLGIARNVLREWARDEARRPRTIATPDVELPDPASQSSSPFDGERLPECLSALAERERSVVVLTFHDHHGSAEIGARLGVSPGNVRVIRTRALQRLRDCLAAGSEATP